MKHTCPFCAAEYEYRNAFAEHVIVQHAKRIENDKLEIIFECWCGRKFMAAHSEDTGYVQSAVWHFVDHLTEVLDTGTLEAHILEGVIDKMF
jgi:hypothetical protein